MQARPRINRSTPISNPSHMRKAPRLAGPAVLMLIASLGCAGQTRSADSDATTAPTVATEAAQLPVEIRQLLDAGGHLLAHTVHDLYGNGRRDVALIVSDPRTPADMRCRFYVLAERNNGLAVGALNDRIVNCTTRNLPMEVDVLDDDLVAETGRLTYVEQYANSNVTYRFVLAPSGAWQLNGVSRAAPYTTRSGELDVAVTTAGPEEFGSIALPDVDPDRLGKLLDTLEDTRK